MLSDRHRAVLDFIIGYKGDNDGNSPSIRDIVENCQVRSTSHAGKILKKLQDHGLIRFTPKQARTIRVVGGKWVFERDGETKSN